MAERIPIKLTVTGGAKLDFLWQNPKGKDYHYQLTAKSLVAPSQAVRDALEAVVRAIWGGKPSGEALKKLATEGQNLRNAIFRGLDFAGAIAGQNVRDKFLPSLGPAMLTVLVTEDVHIPWGLMYDGDLTKLTGAETSFADYSDFWCIKHRVSTRLQAISDNPIDVPRKATEARLLSMTNDILWKSAIGRLPDDEQPAVDQLLNLKRHHRATSSKDFFKQWADSHQDLDVLYVYCHANPTTLLIADEDEVSVEGFYDKLFHDPVQTRPACLVFLNGCRTAVGQNESGFLEATGRPGFCGFIGTEAVVPDVFAMRFGADFLTRLFHDGKTVGEIMGNLRVEHWPLSLVYSTSCHPFLRVEAEAGAAPVNLPKVELAKYDLANAQEM